VLFVVDCFALHNQPVTNTLNTPLTLRQSHTRAKTNSSCVFCVVDCFHCAVKATHTDIINTTITIIHILTPTLAHTYTTTLSCVFCVVNCFRRAVSATRRRSRHTCTEHGSNIQKTTESTQKWYLQLCLLRRRLLLLCSQSNTQSVLRKCGIVGTVSHSANTDFFIMKV
jgi:hypothetical protein